MQNKKEITPLTGLRGIAALCILTGHYFFWVMPLTPPQIEAVFPRIFTEMFNVADYGMTMFFVLSGFVIACNYAEMEWEERPLHSLARFFLYRFARLYPLLLFFVAVVIWSRPTFSWESLQSGANLLDVITALTGTQSWFPYLSANGDMVIGGNFFLSWSISTEFFLYASFAALMLIATRFTGDGLRLPWLIGYALAALAALAFWTAQPDLPWFPQMTPAQYERWLFEASPYYRMIEFCIGMLAYLALVFFQTNQAIAKVLAPILRHASIAGIAILAAIWLGNLANIISPRHAGTRPLIAIATFLVLIGSLSRNKVNAVLSSRFLVFVGAVSYSLYFFHYLVPQFIAHRALTGPFDDTTAYQALFIFVTNFAVCLLFALAMAYGLYALVEVPCRRFIRKLYH